MKIPSCPKEFGTGLYIGGLVGDGGSGPFQGAIGGVTPIWGPNAPYGCWFFSCEISSDASWL